ncbi:MAG: insulinase family protein [Candidatus Omnitrophica bacterium]|nr:insulinase family protein [Candidatus Omnitrophota bacterium]
MKRKIIIPIIIALLLLGGCLPNQKTTKELKKCHTADKFILQNGLTIVAKKTHHYNLISIELLVKTGSARERGYLGTGISHFLEHLIFKGTENYTTGEIARKIKLLGGEINGFTSHDYTSFCITVPKNNVEEALNILINSVLKPQLKEEDFEKERQVILKEMLIEEDDPQRKLYRLFWNNFYQAHPYKHPIIGYPELFSQLTLEDIVTYHKRNYIPNNIILSIAGDFENSFIENVRRKLSEIERAKEIEPVNITEHFHLSPYDYEEEYPTKLMHLILGFPGIEINHPDLYALDLLATILGGGRSSRLYDRMKIKENLAYTISCFNHTPKEKGILGIYVTGEYKNKEKIIEHVLEEIEKIKKQTISYRELNKAKNILLNQFYLAHETVEDQAHQLAIGELFTGQPEFYSFYIEKIKKVSPQELKIITYKYLLRDSLVVVSLKPSGNYEHRDKNQKTNEDIGNIEKINLKNGLTLLIKEEHFSPTIYINAVFLGGLRLESKENNGIFNLLANLLLKGTNNKTAEEINRLIEENGGSLETFSGINSIGISININSKNIRKGIRLLSEIIKYANFPEKELEKEKKQILARIKEREKKTL